MKWLENALLISALSSMTISLLVFWILGFPAVRAPLVKFYTFNILEESGYEVVWGERNPNNPIARDESTKPIVQIVDESLFLQKRMSGGLKQFKGAHAVELKGGERFYFLLEQPIYPLRKDGTTASGYPLRTVSNVEEKIFGVQNAAHSYSWWAGIGFAVLWAGVSIFSWSRSRKTGKGPAVSRNRRKRGQRVRQVIPISPLPSKAVSLVSPGKHQKNGMVEDWPTLIAQVESELARLPAGEQRDALTQEFARLVDSRRQRTNVAAHLLRTIQKQQNGGKGTAAVSDSKEQMDASRGNGNRTLSLVTAPTFNQLLAIDQYLPPELDPEVVKAVLSRFIRPGRAVFLFNEHYLPLERVRHTLGGRFPAEKVNESVEWLMKVGVIGTPKPHQGKILCSLNLKLGSVGNPGDKIIPVVIQAAREHAKANAR